MAYQPPSPPYHGPPYRHSGNGNKPIRRIVIHCTAGSDAKGAQGTARYFRSDDAGGSAHYITDSDETLQSAYDSVVCWHAPPNSHSIGIEMCCSLSNEGEGHWERDDHQAMMRRTARLTAELCLAYDVPVRKMTVEQVGDNERGICGHWDVSRAFRQSSHWDPGPHFPWGQFMAMVRAEVSAITNPKPPTPDAPEEEMPLTTADAELVVDRLLARKLDDNVGSVNNVLVTGFGRTTNTYNTLIEGGYVNSQLDRIETAIKPVDVDDLANQIADSVIAALPDSESIDKATVVAGVREALGSLDEEAPA